MVLVLLLAIFLAILFPRLMRVMIAIAILSGLWAVNDVRQQIRDKEPVTAPKLTRFMG